MLEGMPVDKPIWRNLQEVHSSSYPSSDFHPLFSHTPPIASVFEGNSHHEVGHSSRRGTLDEFYIAFITWKWIGPRLVTGVEIVTATSQKTKCHLPASSSLNTTDMLTEDSEVTLRGT